MHQLAGGQVAQGLLDLYPLPPALPTVTITPQDAERWLGVRFTPDEMATILRRLEFSVEVQGETLHVRPPDHRLDIGQETVGQADLMEEIARIYGYDRLPETHIADRLPPQVGNPSLEFEERVRDRLVGLGLQEVVTYRLTTPEREARVWAPGTPPDPLPFIQIANPISSDRVVMRHNALAAVLEVVERNARERERIALFEIGPVYLASERGALPDEPRRLAIALIGPRALPSWQGADTSPLDFYDLKGVLLGLLTDLGIPSITVQPEEHPSFHPGKCARVLSDGRKIGVLGEIHPLVCERFDLAGGPLLAAEVDFETLQQLSQTRGKIRPVPTYPPVLEDLAIVVDEGVTAEQVESVIRSAGGSMVSEVSLFDLYRGDQIGPERKSLAYSLTYQAWDRTLTDDEVAQIRARIVRRLETDLGARLRS
jgi:phenylalanyl-tRNA synthetase beta chain